MPRYFFDVSEGKTLSTDQLGLEFADFERARSEACDTLAQLMKDTGGAVPLSIVVRDHNKRPIFEAGVSFTYARAVGRQFGCPDQVAAATQ